MASVEPRLALTEDEARIERAMEALGASERAGASAGLGERVFAASAPALRGAAGAVEQRGAPGVRRHASAEARLTARTPRHGRTGRRRGLAVAAGLGALVCAGALWVTLQVGSDRGSQRVSPGPVIADLDTGAGVAVGAGAERGVAEVAAIEDEVEALFAASSMLSTGVDAEIAAIRLDAAALGLGLADPVAGEPGGMTDSLGGSFGGSWGGGSL